MEINEDKLYVMGITKKKKKKKRKDVLKEKRLGLLNQL